MRKAFVTFLVSFTLLIGLTASTVSAGFPSGRSERHPKIRQAINALEAARGDLQDAARDFCGHRAEALEAVNHAIEQLNLALASDQAANAEHNAPALVMPGYEPPLPVGAQRNGERHPMIRRAMNALAAAKTDLQQAAHDFKGHRAEAVEAIDRAQNQLRQALACDKN